MAKSRRQLASGGRKPPEFARVPIRGLTPPARQARVGFTLVELLVAISIIVLLAGLTVAFLPSVQEQQRSADGAVQLQRWLSVAQQRARRDQAGKGLRLIVGANSQVVNCQYLEQPDDFFIRGAFIAGLTGTMVAFSGVDFYQGQTDSSLWAVQPGDFLEVNGGGPVHVIQSVVSSSALALAPVLNTTGTSTAPSQITPAITGLLPNVSNISLGCFLDLGTSLGSNPVVVTKIVNNTITVYGSIPSGPFTIQSHGIASYGPGTTFRIIRAPRITGDEQLQLPNNIVVDLQTNINYNNNPQSPGSNLDIMFSPTGAVTSPNLAQGILALWVRDLNAGPVANGTVEFELSPTIIAVYARSGLIAAHPPAMPPSNPYAFLFGGQPQ